MLRLQRVNDLERGTYTRNAVKYLKCSQRDTKHQMQISLKKKEKMNIVEDAFYIINGIFVVLMIRSVCCVVLIHSIH